MLCVDIKVFGFQRDHEISLEIPLACLEPGLPPAVGLESSGLEERARRLEGLRVTSGCDAALGIHFAGLASGEGLSFFRPVDKLACC